VVCRYDERVRELLDFSIYLDISDDVKFAWKIQVSHQLLYTINL
jgi:uridine kinase